MSAESILADLLDSGIDPRVTPDGLGIEVPAGRLTAAQRQAVITHKVDLIAHLIETSQIMELLIPSAMRRCNHFGDDAEARAQMRRKCVATPQNLQADLLQYFKDTTIGGHDAN